MSSAKAFLYTTAAFTIQSLLIVPLGGCLQAPVRSAQDGIELREYYVAAPQNNDVQTSADTESQKESLEETAQQTPNVLWWTLYNDPDLDTLITQALSDSPTLAQIRARLKQAEALRREYSASLWPSLSLQATRSTYNGSSDVPSDFDLIGAASYEIDLWGKNRALNKTYALKEQATQNDLHAGAITLSANVVNSWLQVLALVEQETLLRQQIETNETIYELIKTRFEMGSASALDVLQQEEALSALNASLPDILSAQAQAANALSLLIGKVPGDHTVAMHAAQLPEPLALPDTGLPSDLIQNRPDILAAWLRLQSGDQAVIVAQTNRLPSFDLSATYAAGNTKIADILDSWLLSLAGGITAPVFEGGALEAEQHYREALADEAYHAYRQTVLEAVHDVENALIDNHYQDEKIKALHTQLTAAEKTLEQAQTSYANGQSTYINVLSSLTTKQTLEQNLVSAQLAQAKARVSLYRALGGQSWAGIIPSASALISYPGTWNQNKEMEKAQL